MHSVSPSLAPVDIFPYIEDRQARILENENLQFIRPSLCQLSTKAISCTEVRKIVSVLCFLFPRTNLCMVSRLRNAASFHSATAFDSCPSIVRLDLSRDRVLSNGNPLHCTSCQSPPGSSPPCAGSRRHGLLPGVTCDCLLPFVHPLLSQVTLQLKQQTPLAGGHLCRFAEVQEFGFLASLSLVLGGLHISIHLIFPHPRSKVARMFDAVGE